MTNSNELKHLAGRMSDDVKELHLEKIWQATLYLPIFETPTGLKVKHFGGRKGDMPMWLAFDNGCNLGMGRFFLMPESEVDQLNLDDFAGDQVHQGVAADKPAEYLDSICAVLTGAMRSKEWMAALRVTCNSLLSASGRVVEGPGDEEGTALEDLEKIRRLLDGQEWGCDTAVRISEVLLARGMVIREPFTDEEEDV